METKDILKLTPDEFADIEMYAQIGARILEIERTYQIDEATRLMYFLQKFLESNKDFERNHKELFGKYQFLVIWLKFIALPVITDNDLYLLIKEHLVEGGRLKIDLREKIKMLFKNTWDPFIYGEKKDLILKAISQNNEVIGNYKLQSSSGDSQLRLTVGLLVRNYNGFIKSDAERGGLERANYLDNSPNMRQLIPRDRNLILTILQVYDFVRWPPLEEIAREMTVSPIISAVRQTAPAAKKGLPTTPLKPLAEPRNIKPPELVDPVQLLKQKFQAYRAQRQRILNLEDQILVQTKGEVESIKKELAIASRNDDKDRVIACLKVLAREKYLINALKDNLAWFEATAEYIKKKYSKKDNPEEIRQVISNLKLEPATPAALAELLQYLLKDKCQMTENDSALIGVEIGQLLGEKYQGIAYGNQESGSFEWVENKIVDNKLASELD